MLIYKITNDVNDKIYIGQTINSLEERIREYHVEVNYSKHNRPITDAMRKYGLKHFKFEIVIDNIQSKEEMDELERYYIKKLHTTCKENGYNIELGGNSIGKHSEETRRKISLAQMGELNHRFGKVGREDATSKPILELTTGLIFESANLAAQYFELGFSHVCECARGGRGSTGGYVFRYLDESSNPIRPNSPAKIKSLKTRQQILDKYKHLI